MDVTTLRRRPVVLAVVSTTVALLAALLAGVSVAALTHDDAPSVDATLRLTDKEPEAVDPSTDEGAFPTTSLARLEGGLTSLEAYEGKPVVVNFFASYCVACIAEMPALQKIYRDLGDRVSFVGIDVRDPQKDAEAFVRRTGVTYDILRDAAGTLTTEVGVINLPATFLLAADGTIVEAHAGEIEERELRRLLAEHFAIT
jgi:cytochrome c biogenesis protein CcmG/thiol:disulfide interchange protein DsbE